MRLVDIDGLSNKQETTKDAPSGQMPAGVGANPERAATITKRPKGLQKNSCQAEGSNVLLHWRSEQFFDIPRWRV